MDKHFRDHNRDHNTLHVIAVMSNPAMYQGRYTLFLDFEARIKAIPGVHLVIVEQGFGARNFVLTEPNNPDHVQVVSSDALWLKENLINLGFARLHQTHPNWEYAAWIDADVAFTNPETLVIRTIHALQHHPVVQMFESSMDLTATGSILRIRKSFAASYVARQHWEASGYNDAMNHTGYAWAIRRDAIDALGGLVDYDIIGSADWHMAFAMVGKVEESLPSQIVGTYRNWLKTFEERCERVLRRDIGCVPGTAIHHWHGSRASRKYESRWKIIADNQFDPSTDLVRDTQGLWRLAGNKPRLKNALQSYFYSRNEDSREEG